MLIVRPVGQSGSIPSIFLRRFHWQLDTRFRRDSFELIWGAAPLPFHGGSEWGSRAAIPAPLWSRVISTRTVLKTPSTSRPVG
jgi:hypothetical protein